MNYNTKDLLIRLLETLNSDYEPNIWKLYIADNGSTDGTAEELDRRNFEHYHVEDIFLNENIGYSAAINDMASRSNSEFLCAVNADTWFTTSHVKDVIKSFETHPKAGVIGVKQLDEESRIRHGGIFWDNIHNPTHRGWSQFDPNDAMCKDAIQCWTVSGSIYYVRRSAWDEAANYQPYRDLFPQNTGAFLPTPHYFEETFCSQMMHHLGWQVWYDGTVETAGHTWQASSGDVSNYFQISRQIYLETCDRLGIHHEC